MPHIWSLMRADVGEVLRFGETVIIGKKAREFDRIETKLRRDQVVIDLVRAFDTAPDGREYNGICW